MAGLLLAGSLRVGNAFAQPAVEQGLLCRGAIRQAELGSALPPHLLGGIALVESGRRDPVSGRFHPWPWIINSEGRDHIFDTKADAVAYARQLQARGVRSFDAGCLQVNLMYHPDAFASLEEAFDPAANARYAVKFLTELHDKTGSWETASAWYHSANPEEGLPYRGKVVSAMAEEAKAAPAYASLPAYALLPGSNPFGAGLAAARPVLPASSPLNHMPPVITPHGISSPGTGFAMNSMPARMGGTVMMLSGPPGGRILPQAGAGSSTLAALAAATPIAGSSIAGNPIAGSLAAGSPAAPNPAAGPAPFGGVMGGVAGVGRGLAAYRMQPVAVSGRLFASR